MFTNYFKIALRVLVRNKGYSFINIAGLAVGMACSMLILLWVQDELSFDRFHANAGDLYQVEEDQFYSGRTFHVTVTPHPVGPAFHEEIPEIVDATRFNWLGSLLLRHGDDAFYEDGIAAADPAFFRMFTFPFIKGDPATALDDPHSLVLTEEMADKHFAETDPMGQVVMINNQYAMTITGVIEDVPHNSSLQFDMLIPFEFMKVMGRYSDSWGSNSIRTFVQLQGKQPLEPINTKMTDLVHARAETTTEFMLFPYADIHLHAYFGFVRTMGNIKYVYIFSVIALFVLLIACINFMNLSTARSAKRAREIGMRKAVGALRRHIAWQFLGESILLSVISLLFAGVLVAALLQPFNTLSGKEMTLDVLIGGRFLLGMIGITLLTGLVAGSYPALFLSAFRPVTVLKGSLGSGSTRSVFRRAMVIVQFGLSIFLIIGTIVIYNQLHYMQNKKLGYDKEHLVYVRMNDDIRASYEALKTEWMADPSIEGVTATWMRPTNIGSNSGGADWDGKDPEQSVLIGFNSVDVDFIETLKIEMLEGRSFSNDFPADEAIDSTGVFLINEEVAELMGKASVVGENFSFMGMQGTIIGVMQNFHYRSVRAEIEPLALFYRPSNLNYILIRVQPEDIQSSVASLQDAWSRVVPDYPFDYHFLDEDFDRMYRTEERLSDLLTYFAVMAVFIACLGLFGLASFTAEQRRREVGIRKVLGATPFNLSLLLCKEFVVLVALANLIAWPVAWYVMRGWLEDFAYRTTMGWEVFALAGALALVIALGTVSFQAVKAALANPVDSLRYE